MTTLRNAAQQALDALDSDNPDAQLRAAIALRVALVEPQQEPDPGAYHGWVLRDVLFDNGEPVGHREPQPLTDEEIEQCCYEADSAADDHSQTWKWTEAFARAIEAAHGIKEKNK